MPSEETNNRARNGSQESPPKSRIVNTNSFDTMVMVEVGEEGRIFHIHKELLCDNSNLKAAFGDLEMSQKKMITLAHEDPFIFQEFQFWLYTGELSPYFRNCGHIESEPTAPPIWADRFLKLYVFANKRSVHALHNPLIDVFVQNGRQWLETPVYLIPNIYSRTSSNAALRKLFVDCFVAFANRFGDTILDSSEYYTKEYLFDVAKTFAGNCRSGHCIDPWEDASRYHI